MTIETLSPIHIGSGEEYEPYNFAIDEREEKLYYFGEDLARIFMNRPDLLPPSIFMNPNAPWTVHAHLTRLIENLKPFAVYSVKVAPGLVRKHRDVLRRETEFRRIEGQQQSQFQLKRHVRRQAKVKGKYTQSAYIPGSSLKGALSTPLQTLFLREYGKREWWKMFGSDFRNGEDPTSRLAKCIKVSDTTLVTKPEEEIGFAISVPRFRHTPTGRSIPVYVEVAKKGKWRTQITLNDECFKLVDRGNVSKIKGVSLLKIEKLVQAVNSHYIPLLESQIKEHDLMTKLFRNVPRADKKHYREFVEWVLRERDNPKNFTPHRKHDYTRKYLQDSFVTKALQKIKEVERINSAGRKKWAMIMRVGRFTQSRGMTIEDLRTVEIRNPRKRTSYWADNETTFWGYSGSERREELLPFGWIVCTLEEL